MKKIKSKFSIFKLLEKVAQVANPAFLQIKRYMMMLLRGVGFLHGKSIMHRDLKPANLLISRDIQYTYTIG